MKMKNILRYIALVILILTLSNCEGVLDEKPDGNITMDEIFSDNNKVGAWLNSCYTYIPIKGNRYYFWIFGPAAWSDEGWDADAEYNPTMMSGRLYNGVASASDHPILDNPLDAGNGDYWNRYWAGIRLCTIFLDRIDDATVDNPADRKRWKAEAHVLRAWYYMELLMWFGDVLPIEREPYSLDEDFSKLKRASYYEVVKFIQEDCNAALATNELPWRITTSAEGYRVTKACAATIRQKMMLYAASPLNNDGENHWEEAYQISKESLELLKSNGYELYNSVSYPNIYLSDDAFLGPDKNIHSAILNEYFCTTPDFAASPRDKETIFHTNAGQDYIYYRNGIGVQSGFRTSLCPSQELVDAYETIDGQPILDLSNPYLDEQHTLPNYNPDNTLYDPDNPYENRDPRFYASIYYNGSKRKAFWSFDELPASVENYPAPAGYRTRIIATWVGEPKTGTENQKRTGCRTGYYGRKFLHPNSGSNMPIAGSRYKYFRLGEVILDFAEAACEAGHLSESVEAVNEIRRRAGMPDLPDGLTQDELRLRVRNERRVELAFEEPRYFDLRRWTKPGDDLSSTHKWIGAMEITRNSDGTYNYKRRPVRPVERACYTEKYIWLPIPHAEANRLRTLTGEDWQNPGW